MTNSDVKEQAKKMADDPVDRILKQATAPEAIDNQLLLELVKILAIREARIANEDAQKERARSFKDQSQKQDSIAYMQDMIRKQKLCKHKKGNSVKGAKAATDFAVYLHTFIDKKQVIKCQLCGMKWFAGDTAEFLIRGGKPIPNWTKIGWDRALEMFEESSNKASASEVPLTEAPKIEIPTTKQGELPENLQL